MTSRELHPSRIFPYLPEEVSEPNPRCRRLSPRDSVPPPMEGKLRASTLESARHAEMPPKEIEFAELEEGSLVELIEDPQDVERTLLAICKIGVVRYTNKVEDRGRILVPMARMALGLADVRLPTGAISYGSVQELCGTLINLVSRCIAIPKHYLGVIASYVIYTWVADRLPVAVYLSIFGLPASGKTTLLQLLNLICRRPLLVSDITPAAAYEACGQYGVCLLMDENEWTTSQASRARCRQLRAGTVRNLRARRLQKSDHCFGPKVFSSIEPPDDLALNSRCIQIPMTEVNEPNLLKPTDARIMKIAGELQQKCLQFRFDHYKTVKPAAIRDADKLRPRTRDLLSSLAAPFAHDAEWVELLSNFFLRIHDPATAEPLSPAHNAVLAALFWHIHVRGQKECIGIGSFCQFVNDFIRMSGERFALAPRKAGSVLSSLGFTFRERTNRGWRIWLSSADRARVHKLVNFYGSEHLNDPVLRDLMERCPICEATGKAPAARPGQEEQASEHRARCELHCV